MVGSKTVQQLHLIDVACHASWTGWSQGHMLMLCFCVGASALPSRNFARMGLVGREPSWVIGLLCQPRRVGISVLLSQTKLVHTFKLCLLEHSHQKIAQVPSRPFDLKGDFWAEWDRDPSCGLWRTEWEQYGLDLLFILLWLALWFFWQITGLFSRLTCLIYSHENALYDRVLLTVPLTPEALAK